jgi:hypothetical protein
LRLNTLVSVEHSLRKRSIARRLSVGVELRLQVREIV